MEDAEPVLVPGYRLDRYELLTPIASGGMASVWLARLRGKRGFEKLFAIKTIKSELTEDKRFQDMFLDEARIASAIQHPNVAQILDLGEQGDVLYIVMEWVDGDSLARIRRLAQKKGTPLPLGLALRVLADACGGLHAAHELTDRQGKRLNVVHRDVSPHNVLVSAAGGVKVIDFGVAKALDRHAGDTRTGIVKGKIRYMAPEQAQGKPLDRRADVWAVGVCLHELVTGELPFDGDSDVDVLRRLMGEEAPPRATGAIPRAIEEILSTSLVRDPEARYPTAAAMQRALQNAIEELGLPATNEDLADFLHDNLPELETKRGEAVAKALASSEGRGGDAGPAVEEAALAPTVLSERKAEARSSPTAETVSAPAPKVVKPKAKKKKARPKDARADEESKLTPGPSALTEQKSAPPRRGLYWGLGLVAAAAAAWFVWPGGATLRGMVSSDPPPRAVPATTAATAAPSVAAAPPKATATAMATAAATAAASTTATAVPTASAAAPDAGKRLRKPRGPKKTAPDGTAEPEEPADPDSPYN